MSLTPEDVKKVAYLARLQVPGHEIPTHVKNLSNILHLIEQMNASNTEGVAPMAHPLQAQQVFRPDAVIEFNQRTLFQSIAPMVESGLYLVPKVIE